MNPKKLQFLCDCICQEEDFAPQLTLPALWQQAIQCTVLNTSEATDMEVRSIFSCVNQEANRAQNKVYSPEKQHIENAFCISDFDNKFNKNILIDDEVLKKLWQNKDFETLFYYFKASAWCFTGTQGDEYTSKFSFLHIATAFASCLHDLEGKERNEYPFLLCCLDISGIQNHVYNIHNSRAYRTLKGRSFYLYVLLDSIIQKIIQTFEGCISQVIYSAGGKAYLLLPNTADASDKIKGIETQVAKQVFEEFQEDLFVCIDHIHFHIQPQADSFAIITDAKNIEGKPIHNYTDLWKAVSEKTAEKKKMKHRLMLEADFDKYFRSENWEDDTPETAGYTACAITGRPVEKIKENELNEEKNKDVEEDKKLYLLSALKRQTEAGKKLRNAQYISTHTGEGNLQPLGLENAYTLEKKEGGKTYRLNPTEWTNHETNYHFMFYGGNQQATINADKDLKKFEDLVEATGFRKLAVLRADVDNLGDIFTNRLGGGLPKYKTFVHYATLSDRLDWFFSGYLNSLRNSDDYKDWVNIVYAGGDDLFVVGRWDKVIDFAKEMQEKFTEYVHNDKITLSAGIAIAQPKFPIAKLAELAGEALDEAKKHPHQKGVLPEKNALTLFGKTVSWKEFEQVYKLAGKFKDLLNKEDRKEQISKGFIYKLLAYDAQRKEGKNQWRWHAAYYVGRYRENENKSDTIKALCEAIGISLGIGSKSFSWNSVKFENVGTVRTLYLLSLSAELADYWTREK